MPTGTRRRQRERRRQQRPRIGEPRHRSARRSREYQCDEHAERHRVASDRQQREQDTGPPTQEELHAWGRRAVEPEARRAWQFSC